MKLWIIFLFLNNGLMKAASSAGVTPTTPSEALKPTEDGSTMLVVNESMKTLHQGGK